MIVFFISTWPSESGLSQSTVHPHLAQLVNYECVDKVIYFSVEEESPKTFSESTGKVEHIPILPSSTKSFLPSKISAHFVIRREVMNKAVEYRPSLVICRGAPAGIYGDLIHRRYGTPFYVESFEPHAEYMASSGLWSRFGLKYRVQYNWESKVKKTAAGLITVSEEYARYLVERENLEPGRVSTVPCWVDIEKFQYNEHKRKTLRDQLGVGNSIVCVYLGKFGGLYYDKEAFQALRVIREAIGVHLYLMILTQSNSEQVKLSLLENGFTKQDYFVEKVQRDQLSQYLSAADIAISFHRSSEWSFSFSPIKHGEYWACGLPVMIPENVGDESKWVEKERVGAIADIEDKSSVWQSSLKLIDIVNENDHRKRIRQFVINNRGGASLASVYNKIVSNIP